MNLVPDDFIIMPDHIHGITGINEYNQFENRNIGDCGRDAMRGVSTSDTNDGLLQKGKINQGHRKIIFIRDTWIQICRYNDCPKNQ